MSKVTVVQLDARQLEQITKRLDRIEGHLAELAASGDEPSADAAECQRCQQATGDVTTTAAGRLCGVCRGVVTEEVPQ